jgi:hypothetical protein
MEGYALSPSLLEESENAAPARSLLPPLLSVGSWPKLEKPSPKPSSLSAGSQQILEKTPPRPGIEKTPTSPPSTLLADASPPPPWSPFLTAVAGTTSMPTASPAN